MSRSLIYQRPKSSFGDWPNERRMQAEVDVLSGNSEEVTMANSAATPSRSIQSMPVRIHDAPRLANLAGDQRQLLVRNPTHIDRNVQQIVG